MKKMVVVVILAVSSFANAGIHERLAYRVLSTEVKLGKAYASADEINKQMIYSMDEAVQRSKSINSKKFTIRAVDDTHNSFFVDIKSQLPHAIMIKINVNNSISEAQMNALTTTLKNRGLADGSPNHIYKLSNEPGNKNIGILINTNASYGIPRADEDVIMAVLSDISNFYEHVVLKGSKVTPVLSKKTILIPATATVK